jgi:tyrosinase
VDIEALAYEYEPCTIPEDEPEDTPMPVVRLAGISREQRPGSFMVGASAMHENSKDWTIVGVEPVFSRSHVSSCGNCANTLNVVAHKSLPPDFPLEGRDTSPRRTG